MALASIKRWSVAACAVASVVACTAGRSTAAAAAAPVSPRFVGMNVDGPVWPDPSVDLPHQLAVMVASGVESMRVVFDWAQAQPYGSWKEVPAAQEREFQDVAGIPTDFSALDQLVGLASARGLTVLPEIVDAPRWDSQTWEGGAVAVPKSPAPYGAFVKGLVRRYGPGGSFWSAHRGSPTVPITMWQIWNEPSILEFWPVQPFAARYVALLRAAHEAIKSADPTAEVVLAGLPNYSWLDLARIYGVRGARSLFDVVAVHPYTRNPRGVITILSYVREVMNQAGDERKPILADEISWPSSRGQTELDPSYDFTTTEAGQARNIGKLLPMLASNRRRLGLLGFYYYNWAGSEQHGGSPFGFSGLFRVRSARFIAKPAFDVFRGDALAIEGCRAKGRLASSCEH
jgi:hypothetical protein